MKEADPKPVLSWLKERWSSVVDILQTDIAFSEVSAARALDLAGGVFDSAETLEMLCGMSGYDTI